MVYVAFVLDAYSRRILGWRAATSMRTALVLDALEHAVWTRQREGIGDLAGLIHHHDAGSQYTSIAFTERLAEVGIDPSVGSVGDAFDNALAESMIGLFKTELIKPRAPWRTVEQVEIATLEWVDWFNHRRIDHSGDDGEGQDRGVRGNAFLPLMAGEKVVNIARHSSSPRALERVPQEVERHLHMQAISSSIREPEEEATMVMLSLHPPPRRAPDASAGAPSDGD